MRFPWQASYAPTLAFATLALIGGYGLKASGDRAADQLYKSQLTACDGQNDLRRESNNRIPAHTADTAALRDFLLGAADVRAATYDRDHLQADLQAIHTYRLLARRLDEQVHFSPVSIVNCKKVIPEP